MKIATGRCIIRPFQKNDIENLMTYRNNLEWMKFQGMKGLTAEEYEKKLCTHPLITEGIQLAVISRESESLIGDIYLKQEGTICWIGYTIDPEKARQGYMYETVSAVINSLRNAGITCLKAGADAKNIPSLSLLKKLGFSYLKSDKDELIYEKNLL